MDRNSVFKKLEVQDYHSKYKEKFWGIPQNLVGIYFTSKVFGNFKSAVYVTLCLFLGIVLLGTFFGAVETLDRS